MFDHSFKFFKVFKNINEKGVKINNFESHPHRQAKKVAFYDSFRNFNDFNGKGVKMKKKKG